MLATPRRSTGSADLAASPQLSTTRMPAGGAFCVTYPRPVHRLVHREGASFSTGCDRRRQVERLVLPCVTSLPQSRAARGGNPPPRRAGRGVVSAHDAVFGQPRV